VSIPLHQRLRSRIARYLEQQYQRLQNSPPAPPPVTDENWEILLRLSRQLTLASRYRFVAAQTQVGQRLSQSLRRFAKGCLHHAEDTERLLLAPETPTLRLLMEELQSLDHEFEHVELDWPSKALSVRTERIVLEEIDLGPFEIRLWFNQLGCHQPYAVIAIDPCKPGCCDEITHPHVQSDCLCEGAGRQAIAKSLEQGRLGEFFVLVAQVLRTYNPGSAYCSLTDWHGSPCTDCGNTVSEDEQYTCDRCSSQLCDRCTNCCTCCDETLCNECSSTCESCQCTTCDACLCHCDACDASICSGCVNDDLCPTCYEESKEEQDEEHLFEESILESTPAETASPQTATATTHSAVQPICLGQAAVPA